MALTLTYRADGPFPSYRLFHQQAAYFLQQLVGVAPSQSPAMPTTT